jgi:ketosteroid isomerase-like protein
MRTEAQADTLAVVEKFNDAFGRRDVHAIMAAMTPDCAFESTIPPDGQRYEGQDAVRGFWTEFFGSSPTAVFEAEEAFAAGDRATVRWIYRWTDANGNEGHVRGVDVFRVRDGKVAEKLSYVKG